MSREIIFESHSTSEDNERKIASGHLNPSLSEKGKEQAIALGIRHINSLPDVIFCSDLKRSKETASLAFPNLKKIESPLLREWNYGAYNGKPSDEVEKLKFQHIYNAFPEGEDLKSAIDRILNFLDIQLSQFSTEKIMIIGHRATFYALEHRYKKRTLEEIIVAPWAYRPGWMYKLK